MLQLTGRVIHPGDPGWEDARRGFNARCDYDAHLPRAVVFCQDQQDVINAVAYARHHALPLRARCGRHNYQGYSSLVKDGILIDVSDLAAVRIDREAGTATVGSGLDMLNLTEKLWDAGVTIPLATGPTVGISGLTLGGGFGVTSRKFGLTCDNVLSVEMVNAGGEVIHANAQENADLFWALRGGGGSFGIVTSFTFQTHPIAEVGVFKVTWPWDQFEKVVDVWQRWAYQVEDSLTSLLSLCVDRTITLAGQFTAPSQELPRLPKLLAPLLEKTIPTSVSLQAAPHIVAARLFFGVDPTNPDWAVRRHGDQQIFKCTSALAYEYFSREAIRLLRAQLEQAPPLSAPPSQPSMVQLLGGGGAVGRVGRDATAVVHRAAKFVVQYDSYWTAPQDEAPTSQWITQFRRNMMPHASGAYVNYADDQLEDPLRSYFGSHLERLVVIKQKYDPDDVFNQPHGISVSLHGRAHG